MQVIETEQSSPRKTVLTTFHPGQEVPTHFHLTTMKKMVTIFGYDLIMLSTFLILTFKFVLTISPLSPTLRLKTFES